MCKKAGPLSELVYCFDCRKTYHQACWDKRHNRPVDSDDSDAELATHQKPTPLREQIWIKDLMNKSDKDYLQSHVDDVYTKWFGVPHDEEEPTLVLWSRLSDLLGSSAQTQYPSLCSFFGVTGAGKSTIIESLIKLQQRSHGVEVPVAGSDKESEMSTSGDVHLYADPATIQGPNPLLYAGMYSLLHVQI